MSYAAISILVRMTINLAYLKIALLSGKSARSKLGGLKWLVHVHIYIYIYIYIHIYI